MNRDAKYVKGIIEGYSKLDHGEHYSSGILGKVYFRCQDSIYPGFTNNIDYVLNIYDPNILIMLNTAINKHKNDYVAITYLETEPATVVDVIELTKKV